MAHCLKNLVCLGTTLTVFFPTLRGQVSAQTVPELPAVDSRFLPSLPNAQQSTAYVSRDRAYRYATPINLWAGRTVMIDFRTDEVITFIQLSDLSEIVYTTNAPLDSGQAKVVALRLIEPVEFGGQTTSAIPNLMIATTDREGVVRTYIFNLYPNYGSPSPRTTNGISIVDETVAEAERIALLRRQGQSLPPGVNLNESQKNTIRTGLGRATIEQIEQGLDYSIRQGYTTTDDPIVFEVRELIAQVRNGADLFDQIEQQGIRISIVSALGELGLEQQVQPLLRRPLPTTNQSSQSR